MSNTRPKLALLVIVEDDVDLEAMAIRIRNALWPSVIEIRPGTFHHEHAGTNQVDLFVPKPDAAAQRPYLKWHEQRWDAELRRLVPVDPALC